MVARWHLARAMSSLIWYLSFMRRITSEKNRYLSYRISLKLLNCGSKWFSKSKIITEKLELVAIMMCMNFVLRAFYLWLSKVITRVRMLRLEIGLKISCQFFNQWEKQNQNCSHLVLAIVSCTLSKLWVISRNSDLSITLFAPVVIGWIDYFGIGVSTTIRKPLPWSWYALIKPSLVSV